MLISSKSSPKEEAIPDRALQRLAGAVLIQALQDASNGPRRCREEALEWISGKTTGGFSFEFCCALLRRAPADVRERLRRHNFIPKWEPNMADAASGFSVPPPAAVSPYAAYRAVVAGRGA